MRFPSACALVVRVCADEESREEEPADRWLSERDGSFFSRRFSLCRVQFTVLGNLAREHCGVFAVAVCCVLVVAVLAVA